MKYFMLSFVIFLSLSVYPQKPIKLENIREHIGDSVKLKALIYGGKYLQQVKGAPTFLSVGGEYPNGLLTLVIWNNKRSEFKVVPEEFYNHKMVWISGKIILYKDRPEIAISNPDQIEEVIEPLHKSNRYW